MKFRRKIAILIFLSCLFLTTSFKLTFCSELKVDNVYPPVGIIGQDLEVTIKGSGFDENTRLLIYPYDIAEKPIEGFIDLPYEIQDMIFVDDRAYLSDKMGTLYIINIDTPSTLSILGSITLQNSIKIVTFVINSNKAYIADDSNSINIINLNDPSSPASEGVIPTSDNIRDIYVRDNILYVANENSLNIINISDPAKPSVIQSFDIHAYDFIELDDVLYAGIPNNEYQIIDITIPSVPQLLGNPVKFGKNLTLSGKFSYSVIDGSLQIIDVNTPTSPLIIGNIKIPSLNILDPLQNIIINNNVLYSLRSESGIWVFDVNIPSEPSLLKNTRLFGSSIQGILFDGMICVTQDYGIKLLDVTTASDPLVVMTLDISHDNKLFKSENAVFTTEENRLIWLSLPFEVIPDSLFNETDMSFTVSTPEQSTKYTLRVINGQESFEVSDGIEFMVNIPDYWITPTTHNFGTVNTGTESSPQTFTLYNFSNEDTYINPVSIDHSEFTIKYDDCSEKNIPPKEHCNIVISFSPTSIGKKELFLNFSNAGSSLISSSLNGWAIQEGGYKSEFMWPLLQQPWYFYFPDQLAIDSNEYIYMVDQGNQRIMKFSQNGQLITQWGGYGNGDGQFAFSVNLFFGSSKVDIAIDSSNNVYVFDSKNDRIQKFNSEGKFLFKISEKNNPIIDDNDFISSISIDKNDSLWITTYYGKIHCFDSNGNYLKEWHSNLNDILDYVDFIKISKSNVIHFVGTKNLIKHIVRFKINASFINNWELPDFIVGDGDMYVGTQIGGIAFDSEDNIFITNPGTGYIVKYNPQGEEITKWKEFKNVSELSFIGISIVGNDPKAGIVTDDKDNIYYTNEWENIVKKIKPDGELISQWGNSSKEQGIINGIPSRIAIHPDGSLVIVDTLFKKINFYSTEGIFQYYVRFPCYDDQFFYIHDIAIDDNGYIFLLASSSLGGAGYVLVTEKGSFDFWEIELDSLYGLHNGGIAIDEYNNVFVVPGWGYEYDIKKYKLEMYNNQPTWFYEIKEYTIPSIYSPDDVAVDSEGNIYVLDGHYLAKLSANGDIMKKWGGPGNKEGFFFYPESLKIDDYDRVFVADTYNHRIQIFTNEGELLDTIGDGHGSNPGQFNQPTDVAVTPSGEFLYVVEERNKRHQKFQFVSNMNQPKAIILAGQKSADDNLWNTTQMCANFAFRTLTFRGFTKETIQYLSPNVTLDLDGNGELDDVDGDATRDNLKSAITQWANDAEELVLYLTDHGGDGSFRLSETEILDADDLDTWLDTLQETIPGKVIVIYDACESGSFISRLTPPTGKERIVITSTYPKEEAQFITQGTISFSNYFWTHIFNGLDLKEAFRLAESAMTKPREIQNPIIESNGNGIGNEDEDFTMADNVYIGSGKVIQGEAPAIESVSEPQTIVNSTSATLEAFGVTDADEISRVWAVIRPPNYRQNVSVDPLQDLPTVDMIAREDSRYEGTYDKFNTPGIYQIAVYARDLIGNTSIPLLTTVTLENPLKRRAIIVAGGDQNNAMWPAIEKSVKFAYEALSFQGYPDDNIYLLSPVSIPRVSKLPVQNILSNLEFALNTWTDENTQDVVLYIVGKGDDRVFYINQDEVLSSGQLGEWLNNLQTKISDIPVLIYDACRSESFFTGLTPPQVDKKRILLASTGSNDPAYFLSEGNISFSQYFWNDILNGASVFDAYSSTKKALTDVCREQVPSLDDNGNGIGNDKQDGGLASRFVIGNGIIIGADEPIIGLVMPPYELDGEECVTLWAQDVTSTGTIGEVWAEILPPTQHPGICDVSATTVSLISVGSNRYEKTVCGFSSSGVYEVSVFAMDTDENISMPKKTTVKQLSGLMKGDIDGDGDVDLRDAVTVLKVLANMETSALIRSDYAISGVDVNENDMIGMEELIYILRKVSGI